MAIVEMKKLRLLALKRDRGRILAALQRLRCVHVTDADADAELAAADTGRREELERQIARLDWAIGKIGPFDPMKRPPFSLKPEKNEDDLLAAQASRGDVLEIVARLEEIERTFVELRSKELKEQAEAAGLRPWANLDAPFERLGGTAHSRSLLLSVPPREWEAFCQAAEAFDTPPALEEISRDAGGVNALAVVHEREAARFFALMRARGAAEAAFPGLRGTAQMNLDQLEGRIKRLGQVRAQLRGEIKRMGARTQELKLLRDALELERLQQEAAARFLETGSAFLMTAWTPAKCVERVRKAAAGAARDFDLEFSDPAEDEKPPTHLRNAGVVAPFESVIRMYSLPDYRGLDPTFIMMPFFICYFGLMVSDAAYGIIIGILTAILTWRMRGRGGMGAIIAVVCASSIGTIFWGVMLGGWFGIEDIAPVIGFTPMSDPIKMMLLCLGLGAAQILTGIGVAMYMNLRRGRVLDALLDQGLWYVLFAGIALLFVRPAIGPYVLLAGALGIFLTAGRKKPRLFSKLAGGFSALYGITGYLSDILSYARLFGMGLATGVIALVMNTVAGILMGGVAGSILGVIVLLAGHTFNVGINMLGAYVHTCRLQYIEFFGRFYEDGGEAFRPLTTEGKYVDFTLDRAA